MLWGDQVWKNMSIFNLLNNSDWSQIRELILSQDTSNLNMSNWPKHIANKTTQFIPRVFGAVGARCLHLNVLSRYSSLSFASEYLSRSSIFCPDVPTNLENKRSLCQNNYLIDNTKSQITPILYLISSRSKEWGLVHDLNVL